MPESKAPMPELPFVEKPTFTIGHFHKEGLEVKSFDPVTTACYLRDWQVDECCALFLGWRYEQKEDKYTDSKGRERSFYWEAWINPKGKGTYRLGLDEIKPPKFRTSKWAQVLSLCVELGWEPRLEIHVDSSGKSLHTCTLNLLTQVPACERQGDAICKSFLAAAWTLQEAREAHDQDTKHTIKTGRE